MPIPRRISSIAVTGLLDNFNYEIPFNLDDHVTIIHGPNGYGKTTILKTINSIFKLSYAELIRIPFYHFTIIFDNNDRLMVNKTVQEYSVKSISDKKVRRRFRYKIGFDFFDARLGEINNYNLTETQGSERRLAFSALGLERISPNTWRYESTGEILSEEEVFDRFGDALQINRTEKVPDWLIDLRDTLSIRFIQSQRLQVDTPHRASEYQRTPPVLTVTTYAAELAAAIKAKSVEYAGISQSLDRTFPMRVLKERDNSNLSSDQLRSDFKVLEAKRARLIEAGLLDQNPEEEFQVPKQINEPTKSIFAVYIADTTAKLSVFDDIADKIDLLKNIVNRHFRHKRMSIDKERGFTFSNIDKKPLSPEELSTGEQHELILLYESLFKVKPGSLTLMDEPEISLHVEWQVQFLNDLEEIIKLSKFDVLIATHSPQIINDRWDLTVDLEGLAS